MSVSINGTTGLTFADASSQNTAATGFGFKNRIINGAMGIWQRSTSSTTTGAGYFTADRWASYMPSGSGTISQDTSAVPSGFQYGIRFTSGASNSVCNFYQTIETKNCYDLASQNATLSFYASGTAGVQVYFYIYYSTTTDAAYTSTFTSAARLTVTLTTTPTLYSITAAIPSGAQTIQISAQPVSGMSSGQYYSFTGVQLEKGSTATSFDYRPYGTELALCQRYYQQNVVAGYSGPAVSGVANGAFGQFIVEMRVAPTITWLSNISSINFPTTSVGSFYISNTVKNFWPFRTANGTGQDSRYHDNYSASAEL